MKPVLIIAIAFVLLIPTSVNALEANPENVNLYGVNLIEVEISGEIGEYLGATRLTLTVIAPDNSQKEYDVRITEKGIFSSPITISEDWEYGDYIVYGKYGDVDLGKTSFMIEEPYDPRIESKKQPMETTKIESKNSTPEYDSLKIPAPFIDTTLDPQHYIDRYNNELIYKKWFDDNYSEYSSIYQAVGLEEPKNQKEPRFVDDVLNELDRKSQACPTYECQLSIMYSQMQYANERGFSSYDSLYGINSNSKPDPEPKPTCGAGTELINGICQTIQTDTGNSICGEGTILVNGVCHIDSSYKQPKNKSWFSGWFGSSEKSTKSKAMIQEEKLRANYLALIKEKMCQALDDKIDEIKEQENQYRQIQREMGISANQLFGQDVIGATKDLKNQYLELQRTNDCKKSTSFWNWWN